MNYLLFVVILGLCAGAYYTHAQDQQTIANLQAELDRVGTKGAETAASPTLDRTEPAPAASQEASAAPAMTSPSAAPGHQAAPVVDSHPQVMAIVPDNTHSTAIDSAAQAAQAAASSTDLGTITTLDNHTYTNCKVVKVDPDGVIFNDDTGITKIEYPMMTADLQKKFGYAAPSSP
jgi:hypothetical protein